MASRYEKVFAEDPTHFVRKRSAVKTVAAVAGAIIAAIVFVIVLSNFAFFQAGATDQALSASTTRTSTLTRLGPYGGLIFGAVGAVWLLWVAITGCREWVRVETGAVLRRRFNTAFVGGRPLLETLHERFATGDPGNYTPLPELTKSYDLSVEIWTVAADRIAYVGMTSGRRKDLFRAGLLTFSNAPYDALIVALKHDLTRSLPDLKNPLRQLASQIQMAGQAQTVGHAADQGSGTGAGFAHDQDAAPKPPTL